MSVLVARRPDYFDGEMTNGVEDSAPFEGLCDVQKGVFLQLQRDVRYMDGFLPARGDAG
jgi:hypothetical protein